MIIVTTFFDKTRFNTCNTVEEAEDIIFNLYNGEPMYSMIFETDKEMAESVNLLDSAKVTLERNYFTNRLSNKLMINCKCADNLKDNIIKKIEAKEKAKRRLVRIQKLKEAERIIEDQKQFIETHKDDVCIRIRDECSDLPYYESYECDICGSRTFYGSEMYAVRSDDFDRHKDMCEYCVNEYQKKTAK